MSCCGILAGALLASAAAGATDLHVGGSRIEVTIGPAEPSVPRTVLLAWVERSAGAISAYYGRFPAPRVRLAIVTGGRGRVGGGVTFPGDVPRIRVAAGRRTSQADLEDDWVLPHEMTHLALPDLPNGFEWMEEGLATYVEPVARARQKQLSEARVWNDMARGLPRGLPGPRDRGLDGTSSWGRTYWGGALFWLLADVEIRERTGNHRGLEDALRGILDAGGSIRQAWTAERVLATGDRAVGGTILQDLHSRFGHRAARVDLDALWRRLGVVRQGDGVRLDDTAPAAAVRRAITEGDGSRSSLQRRPVPPVHLAVRGEEPLEPGL